MNIYDNVSKQIENISLAVSITVIVLLFIFLSSTLYLYYKYYRKCIDNKVEDNYIKNEIKKENKKFIENFEKLKDDKKLTNQEKVDKYKEHTLVNYINEKRIIRNRIKIVANTFLILSYLVLCSFMIFAITIRANNDQIFINDTAYVVILSGSMSEKHESNVYLETYELNNQFEASSLIGLDKVYNESDVKLYDVVAYYNDDNVLIVHRIIEIKQDENGYNLYTLRGDSNAFSDDFEKDLTFDQIVAKYNGFNNFGLGLAINYFKSNIGIIAISLALLLIGIYDFFDILLGKRIAIRKTFIAPLIDEENIQLLINLPNNVNDNQEIKENDINDSIYTENVNDHTNEENIKSLPRKKMEPFLEKLEKLDIDLKQNYLDLKQYLLSFNLHHKVSRQFTNYSKSRIRYFCFVIRGQALYMFFKLDSDDLLNESTIPYKKHNKIKYNDLPLCIKLKSNLSFKRAKILIKKTMDKYSILQKQD